MWVLTFSSQVHDANRPLANGSSPTASNQPQSDSTQHRSTQSSVLPGSVQQRPSANASSAPRSAVVAGHGNLRAAPHDSSCAAQPADCDSDDSQVGISRRWNFTDKPFMLQVRRVLCIYYVKHTLFVLSWKTANSNYWSITWGIL